MNPPIEWPSRMNFFRPNCFLHSSIDCTQSASASSAVLLKDDLELFPNPEWMKPKQLDQDEVNNDEVQLVT